jgi:plastocyanin
MPGARHARRGAVLLALASALLALAPAAAAPPAAGVIRGRVELRREHRALETRPSVGELGTPATPDPPDRLRSVVYLEEAPRGAFEEQEGARAVLDQRNEAFVPYVLPITVGTTVVFPNSDRMYHNVFSFSKPKRFDLGRYARGRSKSVRFDRPGVVRVFCEIHSHMSAYILVFAHRFFATTDAEGRYRIDNVPPGAYTVRAWNDGQVRATSTARMPEAGGTVELDFVIQ